MQLVLEALSERGVEASTVDEGGTVVIEVPCGDGDSDCAELLMQIEGWLAERDLPFVPEQQDGRILIRPPAG